MTPQAASLQFIRIPSREQTVAPAVYLDSTKKS